MDSVSIFRSGVVRPQDELLATVPVPLCAGGNDHVEFMDMLLNWPMVFPLPQVPEMQEALRHITAKLHIVSQRQHALGSLELGRDQWFDREDRARLVLHLLYTHKVHLPPYERLPMCFRVLLRCMEKGQYGKWISAPVPQWQLPCLANRDIYLPDIEHPVGGAKRLSDLQRFAMFFLYHKWRCIDLKVPYELWVMLRVIHFLLVHQQPYSLEGDFAQLPRSDLRDAMCHRYGSLHAQTP